MKVLRPTRNLRRRSAAPLPMPEAFADNRYRRYSWNEQSIIKYAPEAPGIYGLYTAIWIYIDETDNLRRCLLDHLACNGGWIDRYRPSGFAFEAIPSREERSGRLARVITETEPLYARGARGGRQASSA